MYKNDKFSNFLFAQNRKFLKNILENNNQEHLSLIEDAFFKYFKNSNLSQIAIAEQSKEKGIVPNDLRSKEFILKEKNDGLKLNVNSKPIYVLYKADNEKEFNIINLYSLSESTNIDEYDSTIRLSPYLTNGFKIENKELFFETLRNLLNNNYKAEISDISSSQFRKGIKKLSETHLNLNTIQSEIFTNVVCKVLGFKRENVDLSELQNCNDFDRVLFGVSLSVRNFFTGNKIIELLQSKELCLDVMNKLKHNLSVGFNDLQFKYAIVTSKKENFYEHSDYNEILKKIDEIEDNKPFDLRIYPNELFFEINFLKKNEGKLFYDNKFKEPFDIDLCKTKMEKHYAIDNIDKLLNQLNHSEILKQTL